MRRSRAVQTLRSPLALLVPLANGVQRISGLGRLRRATNLLWPHRRLERVVARRGAAGAAAAAEQQHRLGLRRGRDPVLLSRAIPMSICADTRPEDFAARVREVSALMDSTNPDLTAFRRAAAS